MPPVVPFAREIAASTAVDFSAVLQNGHPQLPEWFEMPDGGNITFVDGTGTSRSFTDLPAGYRAPIQMRSLTTATQKVRVGAGGAMGESPSVPSSIRVSQLAGAGVDADALAPMFTLRVAFSAGTTGSADDVTVLDAAPFAFRILDSFVIVTTAKSTQTVTLRSATSGGGSALSSAMSVGSTGRVRDASTASSTVAVDGAIYLRRSDRDCAGEVVLLCQKS